MYYYDDRLINKHLRRQFRTTGWMLVLYYIIMNVIAVFVFMADIFIKAFLAALNDAPMPSEEELMNSLLSNGWCYLVAIAFGLVIVLLWKGTGYWKKEIWARGKPMTVGAFFGILCVFLSAQVLVSLFSMVLEAVLNQFGLSAMAAMESATISADSLSMYLYASIGAPITEEILFRGYIQRHLRPYGKKFAIFCSAFLFGIFHGNLIQTPFAFLVGLVLGYVTEEYNIGWAMVLHMINNMVVADALSRVSVWVPETVINIVMAFVLYGSAIAAVVLMIVKRKAISAYLRRERMDRRCIKCFFTNGGVITLMVLMTINMLLMITLL